MISGVSSSGLGYPSLQSNGAQANAVSSLSSRPQDTSATHSLGGNTASQPSNYLSIQKSSSLARPVDAASNTFNAQSDAAENANGDSVQGQGGRPGSSDAKNKLEAQQMEQDQALIAKLAARDREVRAHEQAHMAVGGQYAGAAKYQYQRGPDGVNYAVGGEVPIDISKEASPEETVRKAQVVRKAALAPAEPSAQDRRVATEASRMEAQARQEVLAEQRESVNEPQGSSESAEEGQNPGSNSDSEATASGAGDPNNLPDNSDPLSRDGSDEASKSNSFVDSQSSHIHSRLNASIANTSQEPPQSVGSILNLLA